MLLSKLVSDTAQKDVCTWRLVSSSVAAETTQQRASPVILQASVLLSTERALLSAVVNLTVGLRSVLRALD